MKRLLIFVGLGLFVVGLAVTAIGASGGGATAKNQATAINLCQTHLSSKAAEPVTFHIDPLVAHKDGVYTISGGVDVGEKPTAYSCDVAEQGDKLQLTSADFDD